MFPGKILPLVLVTRLALALRRKDNPPHLDLQDSQVTQHLSQVMLLPQVMCGRRRDQLLCSLIVEGGARAYTHGKIM